MLGVAGCEKPGESVYNLGVDEDHSYVAQGLIVHNCDVLRDTDLFSLGRGVYPLNNVPPLPHPFDRCYQEPLTRPVSQATEPKPQPALQIDPQTADSPGLQRLTPLARARVLRQAEAAIRFAEAGGWNPQAGHQLGRELKQLLDAQARLRSPDA